MHWFIEIFTVPGYLQAIVLLSLISGIGLALGQIKVKGISLGVTCVFFAGIIFGDICKRLGIAVEPTMLTVAQNFGLILFTYTLGVQVGPGFFPSLKQGGIKLNLYALLAIFMTTAATLALYSFTRMTLPDAMGLLSGAATNTPMLGAAQQALLDVHPEQHDIANGMATACAVGYPCGVIGVLACLIMMRFIIHRKDENHKADASSTTYICEFCVSNPAIFGKTIAEIAKMSEKHMTISRVWRDGKVTFPLSDTVLKENDHLLVVLAKDDVDYLKVVFGTAESTDWNRPDINWDTIDGSKLISKHILVSKNSLNGVKIGSLHLRSTLSINITRVNRAGVELIPYQSLRLQLGDRLTVVGEEAAVEKVSEILGNEQKDLRNPNLVTVFIGIVVGIVIGMIPIAIPGMSTPIKLGIAGGPIIIGILMGAFGPRFHLVTFSTRSANLMLRQMGITIYLACLGFFAGADFFPTILCLKGLMWVIVSLFIAIVPTFLCAIIGKKWGKLNYAQNAGVICGAMANPMSLTYASSVTADEEASEAYATVYPLAVFIRVISAQMIMLMLI
ncbi:MAG: putative transporter [Bacteroidales bacterium]|nr:putative transporter [Candidatus Cryptobacteroides caccocaballi]